MEASGQNTKAADAPRTPTEVETRFRAMVSAAGFRVWRYRGDELPVAIECAFGHEHLVPTLSPPPPAPRPRAGCLTLPFRPRAARIVRH